MSNKQDKRVRRILRKNARGLTVELVSGLYALPFWSRVRIAVMVIRGKRKESPRERQG